LLWISSILVWLFLVLLASFVVFDARLTNFCKADISLQRLLSETALVELPPLAATAVERRRETKTLENCILTDWDSDAEDEDKDGKWVDFLKERR